MKEYLILVAGAGLYVIVRLNYVKKKKRVHLACCAASLLAAFR